MKHVASVLFGHCFVDDCDVLTNRADQFSAHNKQKKKTDLFRKIASFVANRATPPLASHFAYLRDHITYSGREKKTESITRRRTFFERQFGVFGSYPVKRGQCCVSITHNEGRLDEPEQRKPLGSTSCCVVGSDGTAKTAESPLMNKQHSARSDEKQ